MTICRLCLLTVLVLLAACEYKVPLTTEHNMPVDTAVLGHWEYIPTDDESADNTRLKIYRFSDTEYLIHYFENKDELYVRAYLIMVDDLKLVQLELIGDDDEPVGKADEELFNVATYQLDGDQLVVRLLNPELVDDELADSELLIQAIVQNKNNPELFGHPGKFKRISD